MNLDQTTPKEQSDLGPYCLQQRLPKHKQTRGADEKSRDWRAKVYGQLVVHEEKTYLIICYSGIYLDQCEHRSTPQNPQPPCMT